MSARPRLESVLKCPVCNSGPQDWVLNAEALGAGPYEDYLFSIYRCRKCGAGITEPVPPDGESHLLRNSGRFPLCGKGDINTYAVFAETNRSLLRPAGRVGCIVPSGIATDNTTKEFFASLIESNTLVSLYDFENAVGLFEGVGHGRF